MVERQVLRAEVLLFVVYLNNTPTAGESVQGRFYRGHKIEYSGGN